MMFDNYARTPWIGLTDLEHNDRTKYVRADAILAIEDGPSGVNVLLFGGSFVRVRGPAKAVKAQLDQFWIDWEVTDEKRRKEHHAKCDARAKEMGITND
jgi:hypothetical protein